MRTCERCECPEPDCSITFNDVDWNLCRDCFNAALNYRDKKSTFDNYSREDYLLNVLEARCAHNYETVETIMKQYDKVNTLYKQLCKEGIDFIRAGV